MAENTVMNSIEGARHIFLNPAGVSQMNMPSTTTERETVDLEDIDIDLSAGVVGSTFVAPEHTLHEKESEYDAVIVACSSGGGKGEVASVTSFQGGRKYLWQPLCGRAIGYSTRRRPFIYVALEELLGFPGEMAATTSFLPELWVQEEQEPIGLRGTFFHTPQRKVLFSQVVELKIADLPRWKPKVMIGKPTFEGEDG
jgi:hypothetical protein